MSKNTEQCKNEINEIKCPSIDKIDTYVFKYEKKDGMYHNT